MNYQNSTEKNTTEYISNSTDGIMTNRLTAWRRNRQRATFQV